MTSEVEPPQSSRALLEHVTGKWAVLILIALSRSHLRWAGLRQEIDEISETMLAVRLRVLIDDGLVERTVDPGPPARVTYRLTSPGQALAALLEPVLDWIDDHTSHPVEDSRRTATTRRNRA
jgi:DNA-binding HxlR family transcriptional regulator